METGRDEGFEDLPVGAVRDVDPVPAEGLADGAEVGERPEACGGLPVKTGRCPEPRCLVLWDDLPAWRIFGGVPDRI